MVDQYAAPYTSTTTKYTKSAAAMPLQPVNMQDIFAACYSSAYAAADPYAGTSCATSSPSQVLRPHPPKYSVLTLPSTPSSPSQVLHPHRPQYSLLAHM